MRSIFLPKGKLSLVIGKTKSSYQLAKVSSWVNFKVTKFNVRFCSRAKSEQNKNRQVHDIFPIVPFLLIF